MGAGCNASFLRSRFRATLQRGSPFLKGTAIMTTEKPKTFADVIAKMNITTERDDQDNEQAADNFFQVADTKFSPVEPRTKKEPSTDDTPVDEPDRASTGNVAHVSTYNDAGEPEEPNAIPPWVVFPPDFKVPAGKIVYFIRLRSSWTDTPKLGDRIVIAWSITDGEEDMALSRCNGKGYRVITESTKQMIRCIDGKRAAFPGARDPKYEVYDVNRFYREIGSKCRSLLETIFRQMHTLNNDELVDFFQSCMVTRSVGLFVMKRVTLIIQYTLKPCLPICSPRITYPCAIE